VALNYNLPVSRLCRFVVILCLGGVPLGACADRPVPPGEQPLGVVDTPAANEIVRPMPLVVGGWAVGPAGITEIRVYLGDELKAVTTLTVARPDVTAVYPALAGETDLHGWNVEIDVGPARGIQSIVVRATDRQRRVADIATVPITIESW
jgi:hypothetical protein